MAQNLMHGKVYKIPIIRLLGILQVHRENLIAPSYRLFRALQRRCRRCSLRQSLKFRHQYQQAA